MRDTSRTPHEGALSDGSLTRMPHLGICGTRVVLDGREDEGVAVAMLVDAGVQDIADEALDRTAHLGACLSYGTAAVAATGADLSDEALDRTRAAAMSTFCGAPQAD